ncbi:MAG: TRAP transporter small permease [Chloroflexi bacterium]|nr:TRAP transporter small permease [Chloroflexota bacterium]
MDRAASPEVATASEREGGNQVWDRLLRGFKKVTDGSLALVWPLLLIMMAYTFVTVIARYIFDYPVHGTVELTEQLMVAVVFLSIVGCQAAARHMRADFIFAFVGQKTKDVLNIIACLVGIIVCALIAWYSWTYAVYSWEVRESTWGVIRFPVYPAKFVVVLGSAMLFLQLTLEVIVLIKNFVGRRQTNR